MLLGEPGTGMCIHRSAGFVLDVVGSELVFGVLTPCTDQQVNATPHLKLSTEPFIHAWAELEDKVYSPSMIEHDNMSLVPIARHFYYGSRGVIANWRMSRRELIHQSGRIGLSAHLKHGKPAKMSVGGTLLDAAGVPWMISDSGGLIPKPEVLVNSLTKIDVDA